MGMFKKSEGKLPVYLQQPIFKCYMIRDFCFIKVKCKTGGITEEQDGLMSDPHGWFYKMSPTNTVGTQKATENSSILSVCMSLPAL